MLVGKKVILRTARNEDVSKLISLASDVREMGDHWPLGLPSEIRWQKRLSETGWWEEDNGLLLITNKQDTILGHILFFKAALYMNAFELGYRIYKPDHWGHGYCTEAVALAAAFLFESKPIGRIQATALVENTGSRRVMEKNNFQYEGIMRGAIFHRGRDQDVALYALVREDAAPLADLLDKGP